MSAKDGGPAFPILTRDAWGRISSNFDPGMSLRDWFAGQALAGLIASNDDEAGDRIAELPGYAYAIADAMLEEREKGK